MTGPASASRPCLHGGSRTARSRPGNTLAVPWPVFRDTTQPRSHGRRPSPGRSPGPSQPRQRPEPAIPARRREERSRRSRSPHRATRRRIRLRMPAALWPAAAGQYPKAQGLRGTTHPRAVPSVVRDWSGAGHGTDPQRGFPIAPATSPPSCTRSCYLIVALPHRGHANPEILAIPRRPCAPIHCRRHAHPWRVMPCGWGGPRLDVRRSSGLTRDRARRIATGTAHGFALTWPMSRLSRRG